MAVSVDYDLGSMTWPDADERLAGADFVHLPLGSIKQHSRHLPVSVDTLRAETLTRKLAEAASPTTWISSDCPRSPTATPNTT